MTVACDGGAGAQAGVLHRDGRRAAPHGSGAHTRLASVHASHVLEILIQGNTNSGHS
jgi:hypothetical protein